jgi:hypothetical protein
VVEEVVVWDGWMTFAVTVWTCVRMCRFQYSSRDADDGTGCQQGFFFFFIFPLATYHTAGISQQATPPYVIKERHL